MKTTMRRLTYLTLAGASLLCLYYSVSATSVLALISAAVIMLYLYVTQNLRLGMLQQVTLSASHTRGIRAPFSRPPNIYDRLTRSRERITQARTLKRRLNERRKFATINQTGSSESPLTDSLGKALFAADTPGNSRHDHKYGGDAMKRKLRNDNVEQAEDKRE